MEAESSTLTSVWANRKVLVTGGLGFLGSSLAVRLAESGAHVTVIDNLTPLYGGNRFNISAAADKIEVIVDDVRNLDVMRPLIAGADTMFHLAAQVSYIDSLSMPYEDLDLNARATLAILECSRALNPRLRILFSSSRMTYGKVEAELITETSPTNPLSLYGIHKLTAEKYLLMYFKDFGIPTTILRLTNPYGPRQQIKHSKYSLVGWFVRQAMDGKVIKIFGDGGQLRDYVFVDDVVEAMLRCAATPRAAGEVINVGSGQSTRFRDMVTAVLACVNRGRAEFVPWPENYERVETGDISLDISKLMGLTSWRPRHSLEDGIQRTFEYYSRHAAHYI
ncbi:MAG TPA: NAD-dependent epimerase/dehydratase family protein [Vicinamibacterales bacterium]|nr:NAD-dependent epimerase/dehydratase family protein [Vicinamibacterales bacterium]